MTNELGIIDLRNNFLSIQYFSLNVKACQYGHQSDPNGIVCKILTHADAPPESKGKFPWVLLDEIDIRVDAVPIRVECEWIWVNLRVMKHSPPGLKRVSEEFDKIRISLPEVGNDDGAYKRCKS